MLLNYSNGQPRPFPATDLLAARGDAVFTGASSARVDTVTIRRLDPTGTAQWERPWKAATPDLSVGLAVATPDGGVVILGHIRGAVDFGDRTLTGMPDRSFAFLVALDAVGATLWAYQLPELSPARMVLAPSGEIWLGGALPTDDPELGDAFLAVATSTGIDRIHHVDGPADQAIRDLEASPDGVAWLQVASYPLEGEQEAVMTIAGHTFRDPGIYVFAFVP
jgi:hypothetical protein